MKKMDLFVTSLFLFCCFGSKGIAEPMQSYIDAYVRLVKPLQMAANIAYWEAATTGKDENFDLFSQYDLQLKKITGDQKQFEILKTLLTQTATDSLLKRQLQVIYNQFLPNQIDPLLQQRIVNQTSLVERKFSTFRGEMNGTLVNQNEIDAILKTEKNSDIRQAAWEAGKQVGEAVSMDILHLVKLRNEAAQSLGFANFHTLSLTSAEQDPDQLDALMAELQQLSEEPFLRIKAELDSILSFNYDIDRHNLMPWHYHDLFFQETPQIFAVDLDRYYENRDVVELARLFFQGIHLPVDQILLHSDLYERAGKNPHAFSTDIDREGDVRILCNVVNNERWMETMLHELGHATYDQYQSPSTPWLLRGAAHSFTTEGVAMFFGRLSRHPVWMQEMLGLSNQERDEITAVADKYMQLKQIIFARWAMVMYYFEKEMYANPDQDLNALWWGLIKKYQHVTPPPQRIKPDWATKIHIALYPAYYHNYLLGELFASQLYEYYRDNVLKAASDEQVAWVEQIKLGDFMRKRVFTLGAKYPWQEMIKKATGEYLSAAAFARQFVK
ncbi:MAG: peptidase M3 [Calditrichaeota bacterium]|nr:MAG: peptidase M3 [Calditrichota bacterium]